MGQKKTYVFNQNVDIKGKLSADKFEFGAEAADRSIYITVGGNDITGDGSISLPFATIKRALANVVMSLPVVVIFKLGAGNFDVDDEDLASIGVFEGAGMLVFEGNGFTVVESSVALTAGNDLMEYVVAPDPSWTPGEHRGRFAGGYPISGNDSDTLRIAKDGLGTIDIEELDTTMTYTGSINILRAGVRINMLNIKFITSASFDISAVEFTTNKCVMDINAGANGLYFKKTVADSQMIDSCVIGTLINTSPTKIKLLSLAAYSTALGKVVYSTNGGFSVDLLLVESNGTIPAIAVMNSKVDAYESTTVPNIKIHNCLVAYAIMNGGRIEGEILTHISDVINFLDCNGSISGARAIFDVANVTGTPTNWYANRPRKMMDSVMGLEIYIKGYDYPNVERGFSEALLNNAGKNIKIGRITQNKAVDVNYAVTRGGLVSKGRLSFIYDGSTYQITEDIYGGEVGLSFDVITDGVDTDLMRLVCTLTDAVDPATFDYDVKRIMV